MPTELPGSTGLLWVKSKMSGRNPLVYCRIPLIAMQGHHTNTEDTGSLGYNSVCYITSRIAWVSMRGIYRYRYRRDPGKLYNNYCYTYLTKDQHPPSNLVVYSTIQCSTMCVCVFFPSILDVKFVGRTSRGHTGGRSHRIFHPPSFCGACLGFCREKDSAIPFPRRP